MGEGFVKLCFHVGVADPPEGSGLGLGLPRTGTGWMALPEAGGGPQSLLPAPAVEGRRTPLLLGSHYPQAGQLAGYL